MYNLITTSKAHLSGQDGGGILLNYLRPAAKVPVLSEEII